MDCKQCNRASKAQFLPVPPGMIGLVVGGADGRKYALTHLVCVRLGVGRLSFLDMTGAPAGLVLHEPTQVVYELGDNPRQLSFSEWLTEIQA